MYITQRYFYLLLYCDFIDYFVQDVYNKAEVEFDRCNRELYRAYKSLLSGVFTDEEDREVFELYSKPHSKVPLSESELLSKQDKAKNKARSMIHEYFSYMYDRLYMRDDISHESKLYFLVIYNQVCQPHINTGIFDALHMLGTDNLARSVFNRFEDDERLNYFFFVSGKAHREIAEVAFRNPYTAERLIKGYNILLRKVEGV